jgi:hypothetical protein
LTKIYCSTVIDETGETLVGYVVIYSCKYSDALKNNAEIVLHIGLWLSLKESNIWGNQSVTEDI